MRISIKAARVNAGYTQTQAGKGIGVSKDVIKAIEKGIREAKVSEMDSLCELYGCTRDDIFLPYKLAKSESKATKSDKPHKNRTA